MNYDGINIDIIKSDHILADKLMTLVIGIRCQDGVVLASDSKLGNEFQSFDAQKIFIPSPDLPYFVIGCSEHTALGDELRSRINCDIQNENPINDWRFKHFLEKIIVELKEIYSNRMDYYSFDILYCIKMTQDRVNLFHTLKEGICEDRKEFDMIGSGQYYAHPFLQVAYSSKITMKEAIWLWAFILQLIDKSNINSYIGGKPQIYTIPDNEDAESVKNINDLLKRMEKPKSVITKLRTTIFDGFK